MPVDWSGTSAFEHGILVDESAYDGSDIFFAGCGVSEYFLVNPRARAAIEQARLTNVGFVESSKLKRPQGVVKPTSPRVE